MPQLRTATIFTLSLLTAFASARAEETIGLDPAWKKSELDGAEQSFLIRGTGDRNNPLRRKLARGYRGSDLFVHFRLRYDAAGIDLPGKGDGEFFVLWLDDKDGGDYDTHHGGVANVGIHVAEGKNCFMVRFNSSQQKFSPVDLVGGREYQVVARLWKNQNGEEAPFDHLALWIDPAPHEEFAPAAAVNSAQGVSVVEWFGFATGRKTEPEDRIEVSDVRIAASWRDILQLPPAPTKPAPTESSPAPSAVKTVSFREHVFPILKQHCFDCHAGEDPESGARLDVFDEVINQVAFHDVSASRLLSLVTSTDDDERMPPAVDGRERMTDEQIQTLAAWIGEGLDWDHELLPAPVPQSDHWAFQPIERPDVPQVEPADRVRTPVDAFIARRHAQLGIQPAPPATAATLARRLALDLTGLPPYSGALRGESEDGAGEDLDAAADAYIERLLSSNEYGERWGRHWLDVARWAESNGHQHNRNRPHAWRYRDYVIAAFQHDKPFDEFIREQVAGDELPFAPDRVIATGFLAAARYSGNELDKDIQRNDILVDAANTTAQAFLGMTLQCAQCHTHKFDPISIRDYYRFQAFFAGGQPGNVVLSEDGAEAARTVGARWELFDSVHERMISSRRKRGFSEPILVTPKSVVGSMKAPERELFSRLETEIASFPQAWSWYSPAASSRLTVAPHEMRWPLPHNARRAAMPQTRLLVRGDVKNVGPQVQPGWPAVFGAAGEIGDKRRTALADWIASENNPLTARVWVNRIWQWHFGRGLVESSGDFGAQGDKPSHPELLDWLACELIDSGWSTRHIHRLILRSRTYRQSAEFSPARAERDPENIALWRWTPRRLEAEAIRDCALSVADKIDTTAGGPSVSLAQAAKSHRRSVYLQQKRDKLPEALSMFDSPAAVASCSRRRVSTVPLQPLYLLNSRFMQSMAAAFAERVRDVATTDKQRADAALQVALARVPEDNELARAEQFLAENSLESLCLALMNVSEFLYIP